MIRLPAPTTLPKASLRILLRVYRVVSPAKSMPSCRFHPTCSAYAVEAVETHGAAWGAWLAFRRLLRCHPFGPAGLDPVPGRSAPIR